MGNIYRVIDCSSNGAFVSSLSNIISERYGSSSILYNESSVIVSFPFAPEKAFRFVRQYAYTYYGGPVFTCGTFNGSNDITDVTNIVGGIDSYQTGFTTGRVVLGDSFMFFTGNDSYNDFGETNVIIAKTEGGNLVVLSTASGSYYGSYFIATDLTNNRNFTFVDYDTSIDCDLNVPYKTKLMMMYYSSDGDQIMRKTNGDPDTIKDLYMSLYSGFSVTSHAMFSFVNGKNHIGTHLKTSILAEF